MLAKTISSVNENSNSNIGKIYTDLTHDAVKELILMEAYQSVPRNLMRPQFQLDVMNNLHPHDHDQDDFFLSDHIPTQ